MFNTRFILATAVLIFQFIAPIGAAPTTSPSTQNDATDDAGRLTFLGDQLTADEAEIDAINKALLQQGYKVAVANDKAADAAEGNQLMDRKGGAPVRWQDFYGRTAKDFIMHDKDSPVYHQVQRPSQFNYVYHANDTQIEAAKSEVAAIGQKVDALLARRKQLEADQSALWAQIAFQSVGNRDIPLRPLYRDRLQADPAKFDDNRPEPPTVKALAAAVLYLRTADAAATNIESKLDTDQGACYVALRDALNANFKSLQDSEATFDDAAGDNVVQIKQMGDVVASAKLIVSLCTNLTEAYGKAQDAEQANEDARRQLYRRTMQDSLFSFSEAVGQMDDQLQQLSASWNVIPKRGTRSADKVPDITIAPVSSPTPSPSANTAPPAVGAPSAPDHPQIAAAVSPTTPMPNPRAGDCWVNSIGMKLAYIPAGQFMMGDEQNTHADETLHHVTLTKGFYIATTVTTVAQFAAFIKATGFVTQPERAGFGNFWNKDQRKWDRAPGRSWKNPGYKQGDDYPVLYVNAPNAQMFCKWLSDTEHRQYRLPTEAEWEYACRAGTTTTYNTGNGIAALAAAGWYGGNSGGMVHPVAQKAPNAWGLYDMHGNVWQWCSDSYSDYSDKDAVDPTGGTTGRRIARGGDRNTGPEGCRCASRRHADSAGWACDYISFRVAMGADAMPDPSN